MTEVVRAPSRADLVRDEVRTRVGRLQSAFLANSSDAVATLARLRRCSPDEPGVDPTVWETTIGGLPEALRGGMNISVAELYAVHQQSNQTPMHRTKVGLGFAVQTLARDRSRDGEPDQAAIRRLHQVVLSTDPTGRLYHLRGLISLLRSQPIPIPLDYGQLGADLYRLFDPKQNSDSVVARWGRELHNRPRDTTTGEQA
jgi:CRISPR system Cascade subunit CasB